MKKAFILVNALVFGAIASVLVISLTSWATAVLKTSKNIVAREQAFDIAEAGIDYYRWHLAHAQSDYYDGNNATTSPGPYIHEYLDKDGNPIGSFELTITPPPLGSTVVKIKSKGVFYATNSSRTIQVKMAIPSLAKYAVAANDIMRFGAGTEVFGPIHSNDGIRFDGVTHNTITSAKASYDDPDSDDCTPSGKQSFGVHTCSGAADPASGNPVPNRSDVFMAGRQFPVPTIDFAGMTSDLSQIRTKAIAEGKYLAPSGSQGYRIVLKNNDTFDVYKVTSLVAAPSNCTGTSQQNLEGWGTWSVKNQTFLANYPFPANGLIFAEDHIWVEGVINTARVTIVAATFPDNTDTRKSITVNNPLLYTNKDGQDVIALISQNNFNVGLVSSSTLEIDAAIIAQNGRAGRYYYGSSCKVNSINYYDRTALTLYGMIASNRRYGFAYTDGTGYDVRNIIYDANLLYAPPPSFPLTSSQYQIVSWDELK